MENCKTDNISEKRFSEKLLEQGKWSLCKKHRYKCLSKVAVPWILLTSKLLIFSKILTICAVQVFNPVLISPVVSFSRIFSIHQEHLFSRTPMSVYYSLFFLLQCDKFALLKFLLIFICVISVLQLIFQNIYTY